jgi:DNA-binding transcriptional MerR regulator
VNAHDKPQDDTAKSDKQAREMIEKLEAVDQRITPQHVARRFRELLDDIWEDSPRGTGNGSTPLASQLVGLPSGPEVLESAETGYRTSTTAAVAGVTPRQLAYWARTGLIEPSVRAAHGSGSQRLYSFRDVLVLKVAKRLLDTGISLPQIRSTVRHLRDHGTDDLTQVTLMSDGVKVYKCTSPDEIVDLLAGGQAVFGIALGRVGQEAAQELAQLQAAHTVDNFVVTGATSPAPAASHDDLEKSCLRRSG